MSYVDQLDRELAFAGIRGRLARRIVAEIADHLMCDPDADFGHPADLARRFADELGTVRARRAASMGFAALAIAGTLVAIVLAATARANLGLPRLHSHSWVLSNLGIALAALGGQVSFIAGVLAGLRSLRRRRQPVIARDEAVIIRRRTTVALLAGLVCMAGLALLGIEFIHVAPGWWETLALSSAGAGALAITAAFPAVRAALEVEPAAEGSPGDIFEDLGEVIPRRLHGHPWTFALIVASAITVALTGAGVLQSDPYDGALRGLLDGLACLGGFAVLGRHLGLRTERCQRRPELRKLSGTR